MADLTFLTVTSGNTVTSRRGDVKQFTSSTLYPLVAAGGGAVPGIPGWAFRLSRVAGGAFFSITNGATIATAGGVAATPPAAAELWEALEKLHLANYELMLRALGGAGKVPASLIVNPVQPARLPWLAVVLQPGLLTNPLAGFWLADFEKCLAWTILDMEQPSN